MEDTAIGDANGAHCADGVATSTGTVTGGAMMAVSAIVIGIAADVTTKSTTS